MKPSLFVLLSFIACLIECSATELGFEVSPEGITLDEARERVRAAKGDDDITVIIRGGLYRLDRAVTFTPEDSADAGRTITYKAADGERPVFSGGVPVGGWEKCRIDPPHLAPAAAGRLWVADFPEGVGEFKTLFDAKGRLPRAIGPDFKPQLERTDPRVADRRTLFFPEGSLRTYENLQDVDLWIVPTFQWCHNLLPLESVDPVARIARAQLAGSYPLAQREEGYDPSRFRVCNVPDVLDAPGEWFMDSKQRKIWLWPRNDEAPVGVVLPILHELLVLDGDETTGRPVRGLVFDGLTFTHADREIWSEEDIYLQHDWERWNKANCLVRFQTSEDSVLRNCLLTDSGSGGFRMDLHAQGNRIESCELSHLGGTGIALIGMKVGSPFLSRKNKVLNNHVHRIGLEYHHSAGVFVWQSGDNEIAHNRVHHTPYNGFSIGGVLPTQAAGKFGGMRGRELRDVMSPEFPREKLLASGQKITWPELYPFLHSRDNLFAFNELYRNMEVLGDGNPFYIRMAPPGNIIRRNYFHDVFASHCAGAVRFDGRQAGCIFEENVIYRCTGGGVAFHKANRMVNNIVVDIMGNPQSLSGGKITMTSADIENSEGAPFRLSFGPSGKDRDVADYPEAVIRKNVMVRQSGPFSVFYSDNIKWKGRSPNYTDFSLIHNVDRNLMWAPQGRAKLATWFKQLQARGQDRTSQIADPMFVNAAEQDFRFQPESPALKMGIQSIDRREAGLTASFPAWLRVRVADDSDVPLDTASTP